MVSSFETYTTAEMLASFTFEGLGNSDTISIHTDDQNLAGNYRVKVVAPMSTEYLPAGYAPVTLETEEVDIYIH